MTQQAPLNIPLVESGDLEASAATEIPAREPFLQRQRGCCSRLFLTWVFPLLRRAANVEKLTPSDLFPVEARADPDALVASFMSRWRAQQEQLQRLGRENRGNGWMLLRVLMRVHLPTVRLLWAARFLEAIASFAFPLFLQRTIQFVEDESAPLWQGLFLATGLFFAEAATVIIHTIASVGLNSMSFRISASMTASIFRKVVSLRQDALAGFSSGRLNNLITTDVDSARRVIRIIHVLLFTAPIRMVFSLIYLYKLVGVAVFAGMAWLALIAILNPIIMYWQNKLEEKQQEKTDERVFKVTETLAAVHTIKCYAWEEPATRMIEAARKAEIRAMFKLYTLYMVSEAMWGTVLPLTTLVMFWTYSRLNPQVPLQPSVAFTAMTLLAMLNDTIFSIPWVLTSLITALVAAKRIEALFVLPENVASSSLTGFSTSDRSEVSDEPRARSGYVEFSSASFQWLPAISTQQGDGDDNAAGESEDARATQAVNFKLKDITLSIPNGSLVAVVGPTASGKTSLLRAILGEMPLVPPAGSEGDSADEKATRPGELKIDRSRGIAFAPQHPWIFNATVRDNILFGEPLSESKYEECIQCCGLQKDVDTLKSGDLTKVGEKGTTLSGGQKARVGLARAAYRQETSRIFLLDDPYSALDAHVARHVHEEVVQKLLAKRTRIVATNRLEFLASCDRVVVLNEGEMEAAGKPEDVQRQSPTLRKLMVAQGLLEDHELEIADDESATVGDVQLTRGLSGESAKSSEALQRTLSQTGSPKAGDEQGDVEKEQQEVATTVADDEEAYEAGNVKAEIVFYYLRHMGPWPVLLLLVVLYGASEVLSLFSSWWLSVWTDKKPVGEEVFFYLNVYIGFNISLALFMCVRDVTANYFGFRAALRLHAGMFAALLRRPMSFFQDTPNGRIINRFSKDTEEIDKEIIWQVVFCIVPMLQVLGSFALVAVQAWEALLAFAPLFYLFYVVWRFYNKAALDVKRLSKVVSSPVYDHFSNLCRENGISIVRAHDQVQRQFDMNTLLIAEQQKPQYSMLYLEGWFGMRMSHMGNVLVLFVTVFVVLARGKLVKASQAGLVMSMAGTAADMLQGVMDQLSEFGMAFNCVERVREYSDTSPTLLEAPAITDVRPPDGWPQAGRLEIENLQVRYKPELPLVLKGLSVSISGSERMGIVGRTGAGKSSLLMALFRIVEPETGSRILLDGLDTLSMGLHDLRRRLAMIPQEPVLFSADMRYNCDPFGQHSPEHIWKALEEAQLAKWVQEQWQQARPVADASSVNEAQVPEDALKLEIKEGGQNLSAGQRQMVAIARAVLRQSRLVVLDEATAAVDASTDAAIQEAIRRCFAGATTLTIAHRIKTILDSDRIMVLDNGELAELDTPARLRQNPQGIFSQLVEETER